MTEPFWPPENYYRISIKALVFDEEGRLLVCSDDQDGWSMPGGGWDHGEDYEACIIREVAEELGATVKSVGPLAFFYRCKAEHGQPKVSLAFPVTLEEFTFSPNDDEIAAIRFVTKDEFATINFQDGEAPVQAYADQIWQLVEKNNQNR